MKNRFLLVIFAVALAAVLFMSGLGPSVQDLGELEFVRCMGFDLGDEVEITASITTGSSEQESDTDIVTKTGLSINQAVEQLQVAQKKYAFFGYVSQYLVGEETARRGMGDLLGYARRDIHSRLETACYVVRGSSAKEAMETVAKAGAALSDRLTAMERAQQELEIPVTETVRRAMTSMERCGSCLIPAITVKEDGEIESAGYGVFRLDRLVGFVEMEDVQMVNMLLEERGVPTITVVLEEGKVASMDASDFNRKIEPTVENGQVTACRVTLELRLDVAGVMGINDAEWEEEEICRAVERELIESAGRILELGTILNADFLDLTTAIDMKEPGVPISEDVELTFAVSAKLTRSYETTEE